MSSREKITMTVDAETSIFWGFPIGFSYGFGYHFVSLSLLQSTYVFRRSIPVRDLHGHQAPDLASQQFTHIEPWSPREFRCFPKKRQVYFGDMLPAIGDMLGIFLPAIGDILGICLPIMSFWEKYFGAGLVYHLS